MSTRTLATMVLAVLLLGASVPAAAAGSNADTSASGDVAVSATVEDGELVVTVDEDVAGTATATVDAPNATVDGEGSYEVDGSKTVKLTAPERPTDVNVTVETDAGESTHTITVRESGDDSWLSAQVESLTGDESGDVTVDVTLASAADGDAASTDAAASGDADVSVDASADSDASTGANTSADVDVTAGADAESSTDAEASADASADVDANAQGDDAAAGANVDVDVTGVFDSVASLFDGWFGASAGGEASAAADA
ncbi:hypothetical protein ACFQH6_01975 [Halobacteriaceae archaeon GCM10025711]